MASQPRRTRPRKRQKLRLSRTLLVAPQGRNIFCIDYLAKTAVTCAADTLYWLGRFQRWAEPAAVAGRHPDFDRDSLLEQFDQLASLGLLLREGSEAAARETRLLSQWKYGTAAAILHFTCLDSRFMDLGTSLSEQRQQLAKGKPPPLVWTPPRPKKVQTTGLEIVESTRGLLSLMARRRSCRTPARQPVSRDQLMACLLAGLAITGFTHNGVAELPLKMTPSGGARNPFEAFVLARDVSGLTPGLHHFSGLDGSLTPAGRGAPSGDAILAGQDWGADMPAIILLVGFLARSMWKYREANAYRVMLIEAGHIAQNIMLAATAQGLATCPTAALDHRLIGEHLGLDGIAETPIYALALCHPGAENNPYTDNKRMPQALRQVLLPAAATSAPGV